MNSYIFVETAELKKIIEVKAGFNLYELFFFVFYFIQVKSLLESVNTSACIYEFLLSCKERMTLGTNFHFDFLFY